MNFKPMTVNLVKPVMKYNLVLLNMNKTTNHSFTKVP